MYPATCLRMTCILCAGLALVAWSTLPAMASYFATQCSNADASVRLQTGHIGNSLLLVRSNGAGESSRKRTRVPLSAVDVETLSRTVIEERSNDAACERLQAGPVVFWSEVTTVRALRFTMKEGEFLDGSPGLSPDRRVIEATMICIAKSDGLGFCD